MYSANAVLLLLYQIFDNCDGKHARRTGTSSKVGELLDHCVDVTMSTLLVMTMVDLCAMPPISATITILLAQCAVYSNNWFHTVTGVMSMGGRYFSVDEANMVITAAYALAGQTGTAFFRESLLDTGLTVPACVAGTASRLVPASFPEGGTVQVTLQLLMFLSGTIGTGGDTLVKLGRGLSHAAERNQVGMALGELFFFAAVTAPWIIIAANGSVPDPLYVVILLAWPCFGTVAARLVVLRTITRRLVVIGHRLTSAIAIAVPWYMLLSGTLTTETTALDEATVDLLLAVSRALCIISLCNLSHTMVACNEGKPLFWRA